MAVDPGLCLKNIKLQVVLKMYGQWFKHASADKVGIILPHVALQAFTLVTSTPCGRGLIL